MELKVLNGNITGTYTSAVGAAAHQLFPLVGRTDTDEDAGDRNVGFVVSWENDKGSFDCVTAWSGQVVEADGKETLFTTWLLTMESTLDVKWKSTLVGQDVFTRQSPSAQDVASAQQHASHPNHTMRAKSQPEQRTFSYRIFNGADEEIDAGDIEATSAEEAREMLGDGNSSPGTGERRVEIIDENGYVE